MLDEIRSMKDGGTANGLRKNLLPMLFPLHPLLNHSPL
jgi:uncharacterized membrane protein